MASKISQELFSKEKYSRIDGNIKVKGDEMKTKQFLQGIRDGSAIGIGYFSVSFTFGIAAVSSGLVWWQALAVSVMNLTSAGQFAGITIMAAAGSYIEMAVTQLIINLRYALMSISLSQKVDKDFSAGKKMLLGFAVTDEIFAVAMSREGEVSSRYFWGLSVLPFLGWNFGTLTGAVLGDVLPEDIASALGLAIYGMFIAIVVPVAKENRHILKMVLFAVILSSCLYYIPVLNQISDGFAIILSAVISSAVGAWLFPIREENQEEEAAILKEEVESVLIQEEEESL